MKTRKTSPRDTEEIIFFSTKGIETRIAILPATHIIKDEESEQDSKVLLSFDMRNRDLTRLFDVEGEGK